jgi:hypothetical protein
MIYLKNTTKGTTTSSSAGVTISGSPSLNGSVTRGESLSQVSLVELVAPPPCPMSPQQRITGMLVCVGIAALVLTGMTGVGFYGFNAFVMALGIPAAVLNSYTEKREEDAYSEAMYLWERTWLCQRDGHSWIVRD